MNNIVYRCIDNNKYNKQFSNIEFFAINKSYASFFGSVCYQFEIDLTNSKILDLGIWNKIYKERTGENGNIYNKVQGLFVIGSENIESSYKKPLEKFSKAFGTSMANKFLDEFNNCDAIYGEDAGYPDEFVFAVKNKNIVKNLGRVKKTVTEQFIRKLICERIDSAFKNINYN